MDIPPGDSSHIPLILSIIRSDALPADWTNFTFILLGILVLIVCSALFSASENAMFSLGPQVMKELRETDDKTSRTILDLLYNHKRLLATILIANNFVNVSIVFFSTFLFNQTIFDFSASPQLGFVLQAVVVTLILVLFGEVFPKVYATAQNLRIARMMALPLYWLSKIFSPLVFVLENSTNVLDRKLRKKGHQMSLDDLNQAIDITTDNDPSDDEKEILKGIVNFGNIPAKQIMRSRLDVVSLDADLTYAEVLSKIQEWGYSRVPVFRDSFDNVIGILYIKDLIPHIRQTEFDWQSVLRQPYFVPESKKLDDLMNEFQEKRVHMAIVVDEYGGTSGLVTMEDVLEEVFGEIKDEFDEDDFAYSKLDELTYVFEGKTLLHDICRITDTAIDDFEDAKGDADTLGGMLIEMEGKIPNIGARIKHKDYEFVVESADRRRIKRVKMVLPEREGEEES
ncbi:MAG: gliding motility-associated protein GldE [Bacteroidetes bacterium]|nr:MAG: gliding motility-associated protein GldE [Bacteroidota bacterium]